MTVPIQLQNRGEIRRSVGRNLGNVLIGAATSTTDTTSLIDTTNLLGGDDEHNNKQVMIYDAAGSIVDGETRRVTDYAGTSQDATVTAFTASITALDKYELWDTPWLIADINDVINQAIIAATAKGTLKFKQTATQFTLPNVYEYNCLTGYKGLYLVEHCTGVEIEKVIDNCDTEWTEGSNVTVTADTSHYIEGIASNKLVVAAGASATQVLAYHAISKVDLSECDKLEISIYSTIALTAGQLQVRLDDTALGASVVESLDIPATTANTWTRHVITLANPLSDSAIIYVDIYQVADVGACTLYIDYITGVLDGSRVYKELNPSYWSIVQGTTPYLKLTQNGKAQVGNTTLLRLSGYQIPDIFSDDTTDCDIDPGYVIAFATGTLALSHAKSSRLQINDRQKFAQYWLGIAESLKLGLGVPIFPDARFF